jgi:nuclease S1
MPRSDQTSSVTIRVLWLASLSLLLVSAPAQAFAWGCDGHRIVAAIAMHQLNPHALRVAKLLLSGQVIDPSLPRYCQPLDPITFVDVSTWADDIRGQRKDTAPWHFVDIPLGEGGGSVWPYCPPETGCAVRALATNIKTLLNQNASRQSRAEALMYVIHFVGDIHQPLHAITNNDRGANCLPVNFFGNPPQEQTNESYAPNLHGVWDTDLVAKIKGSASDDAFAAMLTHKFSANIHQIRQHPGNIPDWALESHQLAFAYSYGKLPVPVTPETPTPVSLCSDDDHVSHRLAKLKEHVDAGYLSSAGPVIEEQLTKAGTRLAVILNRVWP